MSNSGFKQVPNLPYREELNPCDYKGSTLGDYFYGRKQKIVDNIVDIITSYPTLLNVLIENRAYLNPYNLFLLAKDNEKSDIMKQIKEKTGISPITVDPTGLEEYLFTNRNIFYDTLIKIRPKFSDDLKILFRSYSKELLCIIYNKLYDVVATQNKQKSENLEKQKTFSSQSTFSTSSMNFHPSKQDSSCKDSQTGVIDNFIIIDRNTIRNNPIIRKIKSGVMLTKRDTKLLKSLADIEKTYVASDHGIYKSIDIIDNDTDEFDLYEQEEYAHNLRGLEYGHKNKSKNKNNKNKNKKNKKLKNKFSKKRQKKTHKKSK
jgi:hypothetical protein